MTKYTILILPALYFFVGVHMVFGQTTREVDSIPLPSDTTGCIVIMQKQPEFVGGEAALQRFIRKNFRYPKRALRENITGKVYVSFVVRKNGVIQNISILKGMSNCEECNEEVIRLINIMPNWIPGTQNGNPVNVLYHIPIIFSLNKKTEKK